MIWIVSTEPERTIGRSSVYWRAALFLGYCACIYHGHAEVTDSGCPEPECDGTEMAVSYQCQLRTLTATFSWRRRQGDAPDHQWLQVSLFRTLWDPSAETVQELSLEQGVTSVSLTVEPDSVYYWRLRSERDGRISHTAIQQIETPSCIADFVEDT